MIVKYGYCVLLETLKSHEIQTKARYNTSKMQLGKLEVLIRKRAASKSYHIVRPRDDL